MCSGLEKSELKTLAEGFCLSRLEEAKDIINNAKTYEEGRRKLLGLYDRIYADDRCEVLDLSQTRKKAVYHLEINEQENELLRFIQMFIVEHGFSPVLTEIVEATKSSKSTVYCRLKKLERLNVLCIIPYTVRGIRLMEV